MKLKSITLAAIAGATVATTPTLALADAATTIATLTIDVSGLESWDDIGAPSNFTDSFTLFAESQIVGIGWNVQIITSNASWLSEPTFGFENSDSSGGIYLTPGVGFDQSGNQVFSSGGIIDTIATGQDFYLLPDAVLNMEIFDSYDDDANVIDATFGAQSTVWIQYTVPAIPTPGSLALLGLGGIVAQRRRR